MNESILIHALIKIIQMNRQQAFDQYGDYDKAESWACVKVAKEALFEYNKEHLIEFPNSFDSEQH